MINSVVRFGAVGSVATLIHAGVALACVTVWDISAATGNLAGFAVAFLFAAIAHSTFTFPGTTEKARSSVRYFLVSLSAMVCSQLVVLIAAAGSLDNAIIAIVGAFVAAVISFALSRRWAFR